MNDQPEFSSFAQPQYGGKAVPEPEPSEKDWTVVLLLCLFLGWMGAHRFYTGYTAIGIIQLLTFGGCGLWWFIDASLIANGTYTERNGRPIQRRKEGRV